MSAILAPPAESPSSPLATKQRSPESGRRRFTIAVIVGILLASIPYLWILWVQWNHGPSFLREVDPSNFYELQARAIVLGPSLRAQRCAGHRGLRPRRAPVHVFRGLSFSAANADPHLYPLARRSPHRSVPHARVAGHRRVELGAPLAGTHNDGGAGRTGLGGGGIVRAVCRRHHRGLRPRQPGLRALGLQRRFCLECRPHDGKRLCAAWCAGTSVVATGARRRRSDLGDQP